MNTHKDRNELWELIVLISMIVLMILGLSSCKQIQYVPVEKIVTKDRIVIQKEYDSIKIKVKEYMGHDTIYRDSVVVRYQHRVDTIYKVDRDSIPYPVEVVKEVERSLNWYEKTMIRLGWALIVLLVAIVGWKVSKLYFKRSA